MSGLCAGLPVRVRSMEGSDTFFDAGWKGHEVTRLRQQLECGHQALWWGYKLPDGQI
jgi:hypothetical protein